MAKMAEDDLAYLLEQQSQLSVGYYDSELANDQLEAQRYYKGDPFGNEQEGRSRVVSRDVATTVDSVMPDLIKLFLSGDDVVEFEALEEGQEEQARNATDLVNHIFYKDNDGYTTIHDWAKDGLLNRIGIVQVYWDVTSKIEERVFEDQPEEQLMMMQQDGWDLEEATQQDGTDTWDVKISREVDTSKVRILCVPPEEFFVAPRQQSLEDSEYTATKQSQSISDLIEAGYKRKVVENLGSSGDATDPSFDERRTERYEDENYTFNESETTSTDPQMRKVWVNNEYVRVDFDGDGIAELRHIVRVGTTILSNDPVDFHPFVDFSPIKLSHTIIGKSLADDTMDIQLIKSTLLRQSLDNLYLTNNPRIEVPDAYVGENTFDDLLTVAPGAPIRTKGPGGLIPVTIPFTAGSSFNMLEYWDNERQQRTGVTNYNQGLNMDSLNDSGVAIELIQNKGMGKIELIARNLGNSMGILFRKILRLAIEYQEETRSINVRGKWTQIDVSNLDPDMRVNIQVGLGSGDKVERIKARMAILQQQQQAMSMGLSSLEKIYNNYDGLTRDMDIGDANKYFVEPQEGQKPPPPPPNPVAMQIEAKTKLDQANMQLKAQGQQADNELKAQSNQIEAATDQQKLENDMILGREKIEMEAQLKREQMVAEFELKREEMMLEMELKRLGIGGSVGNVEMGGDLG
tara:strand:- start:4840 stop:6900 length:2061 start_codon:yes stop_codon:yes gene_type:complete